MLVLPGYGFSGLRGGRIIGICVLSDHESHRSLVAFCAVCPVHAVPGCPIRLGLVALEVVPMNPQNRFCFDSAADATEESPVPAVQVRGYSFAYPPEESDCRESSAVLTNVSLCIEQGAF